MTMNNEPTSSISQWILHDNLHQQNKTDMDKLISQLRSTKHVNKEDQYIIYKI